MSGTQPQISSPLEQLQAILQGILSFAAIIYTLGFIIVNSYYTSFGITDYQLVQTRYIAAGLSYLFIHVGVAAMVSTIIILTEIRSKGIWFLAFFMIWGLFGVANYLFSESIINSIVIGTNAGIMILISYLMWAIWSGTKIQWFGPIPRQAIFLFTGIGFLIVACLSALSWGRSFWPIMSPNLGGGRPNEAIFVFNAGSIPDGGLQLIPMQSETVSEQVPILFDNDSEFVILVDIQSDSLIAIRIPKSIIVSVIHAPSEPFGKKQPLPTLSPSTVIP